MFCIYYIDDVCVSADSLTCNLPTGHGIIINNKPPFNIYPNPCTNFFIINYFKLNQPYDLSIYSLLGQQLYQENKIIDNNKKVNINEFNNNILLISIKPKDQSFYYKLLQN